MTAFNMSIAKSFAMNGGAIYVLLGALLSLDSCAFELNFAVANGSAIYQNSNSSLSCSSSLFSRNRGSLGGMLYQDENSQANFRNCSFESNQALRYGGSIFSSRLSNIFIFNCRFWNNSAESGGAIFLKELSKLDLRNSSFQQNKASIASSRCDKTAGSGGAILFSSFDKIAWILTENSFSFNYADRFGGALGFLSVIRVMNSSSIRGFGVFQSNFAGSYGPDFASPSIQISANMIASDVFQGDQLDMTVHFVDNFGQNALPEACTLRLQIDFENSSAAEEDLYFVEPSSLLLSGIPASGNLTFTFTFSFTKALILFPSVFESTYFSLKVVVDELESNPLFVNVRKCKPGYALEADSNLFYKCVPCLSGAFLNSSDSSVIRCSNCPAGKYSPALSTTCYSCPKGRFSASSGGSNSCTECPLGTYSDLISQTSCQLCGMGKYNNLFAGTFCVDCPFDSITLKERAYLVEDCVCPSGTYGVPTQAKCTVCPNFNGLYVM
jgi:hypothetical protein